MTLLVLWRQGPLLCRAVRHADAETTVDRRLEGEPAMRSQVGIVGRGLRG